MRIKSDGCSFSPDFNFRTCCEAHDLAYAEGGTDGQRLAADRCLRDCIRSCGHPVLASIYYVGVRMGGSAFWPYGFSWNLSTEEH